MGTEGFAAHSNVSEALSRAILCVAVGQRSYPSEGYSKANHYSSEGDILELIRKRVSNREIADLLKIRVSTVKFQVSNIFSKMHAPGRRELAADPFSKLGRILTQ